MTNQPNPAAATLRHVPHYLNGSIVAADSGRASDVFNPSYGVVQARLGLAEPDLPRPRSRHGPR